MSEKEKSTDAANENEAVLPEDSTAAEQDSRHGRAA